MTTALAPQHLEIAAPRLCEEGVEKGYSIARAKREPVFVPANIYTDDRGWSLMNQLTGVLGQQGQINFSHQYPGVIKAWHKHERQTDFWICLNGHVKAGVYAQEDNQAWSIVIGEKRPGVLIIPPLLWHGCATVGNEPAGLLYYVSNAYNPIDPDEQRRAFDSVKGFPWQTQHR